MSQKQIVLRWIEAVVLLPCMVLVVVPAALLLLLPQAKWEAGIATPRGIAFWVALPPAAIGGTLAAWTILLFIRFGDGTAAPWDPPRKLIVRGPYRHVRNPMITGVMLMLLAECLIFQSWAVVGWFALFTAGNAVYLPAFEEPGLIRRFGDDYVEYKRHVPRWIPRLRPWIPGVPGSTKPSSGEN